MNPDWLEVHRGDAPLIVSFPHTGTDIPPELERRFVSPWLGRRDADWWIDRLYDFAADLGASTIRTRISRSVIDVNRDPSGASLYPGQATTELCPTTTFDGEPLYVTGLEPDEAEIDRRRSTWFQPYHAAIESEIERLAGSHPRLVLYDAHSIRSRIPRLFEGLLPQFNIGTNSGAACDPALTALFEAACDRAHASRVTDGRFKGGWTTRRYGRPAAGVHAIQIELACRGYMDDPATPPRPQSWPASYSEVQAAPLRATLIDVLKACLAFAKARAPT
jgi:N-formylglutamate deformylase